MKYLPKWQSRYWAKCPKWVLLPLAIITATATIIITVFTDLAINSADNFNGITSQSYRERIRMLNIIIGTIGTVVSCAGAIVTLRPQNRRQYLMLQFYGIFMSIMGGTSITLAVLSGIYWVFALTGLFFTNSLCANFLAKVISQLFPIQHVVPSPRRLVQPPPPPLSSLQAHHNQGYQPDQSAPPPPETQPEPFSTVA